MLLDRLRVRLAPLDSASSSWRSSPLVKERGSRLFLTAGSLGSSASGRLLSVIGRLLSVVARGVGMAAKASFE